MDCCNSPISSARFGVRGVTIPRTVWTVATRSVSVANGITFSALRYRERYGLLQPAVRWSAAAACAPVTIPRTVWTVATLARSVSVGNGMTLRYRERYGLLQPCDGWTVDVGTEWLRYRERYGLLQRGQWYDWIGEPSYDTANGMDCCNPIPKSGQAKAARCYDTANGMDCCNTECSPGRKRLHVVTIPRTVWTVATPRRAARLQDMTTLRYRERYGLLQQQQAPRTRRDFDVTIPRTVWTVATRTRRTYWVCWICYDTANGMDCCNRRHGFLSALLLLMLRYRERYGLLQLEVIDREAGARRVTIPRTVWTVATSRSRQLWKSQSKVTIPRTVWTVATGGMPKGTYVAGVTIPRTVWTVATTGSLVAVT